MNAEKALIKIREKRDEMHKQFPDKRDADLADIIFKTCMDIIEEEKGNDICNLKLDMMDWLKDSTPKTAEPKKKGKINLFYKGAVMPVMVRR